MITHRSKPDPICSGPSSSFLSAGLQGGRQTTLTLVERFQALIRGRKGETLATWIDAAMASPLASFAAGIRADREAVAAAIVEPWSNAQTEGQVTKLKLVKRQMFGRAKLDLLRARLVIAA